MVHKRVHGNPLTWLLLGYPCPCSLHLLAHGGGLVPGVCHRPLHPAHRSALGPRARRGPRPAAPQPTLHRLPGQPALRRQRGIHQRLLPWSGSKCPVLILGLHHCKLLFLSNKVAVHLADIWIEGIHCEKLIMDSITLVRRLLYRKTQQ